MKILLLIEQLVPCSVVPFAMFCLSPDVALAKLAVSLHRGVIGLRQGCQRTGDQVRVRILASRHLPTSQTIPHKHASLAPEHLMIIEVMFFNSDLWLPQWFLTRPDLMMLNQIGTLIWKVNRYPSLKFFCSRFVTVPAESDVCFANRVDAPCPAGGHSDNWQKDTNANKNTAFYSVVMDCELLVNLPFCHLSEMHFFPVSNSNPALFSNRLVLWQ